MLAILPFSYYALEKEMANPLQYSCLENPRDRGTWWAAVYGVTQSQTHLKRLSGGRGLLGLIYKLNFIIDMYAYNKT